jgi:polysaccharide export outer membrane protein
LRNEHYLKEPEVSVFVSEYNSKKIYVLGQVKKPGTYAYEESMSVVEAISIASGFTSMAQENRTMVIRVEEGKETRYQVQVEKIGQGRIPNFFLRTGDIVFVPERIF